MANHIYYNSKLKIWSAPKHDLKKQSSVGEIILSALEKVSNKVIQIFDTGNGIVKKMTGQEIFLKSVEFSEYLKSIGLKSDDLVAVVSKNTTNLSSVIFGSWIAGLTVSVLSPTMEPEDCRPMLTQLKPKILFTSGDNFLVLERILKEIKSDTVLIDLSKYKMEKPKVEKDSTMAYVPCVVYEPENQTALILATAGTTGAPKLACFSHANLISQIIESSNFLNDDVLLLFSDLHTINGMSKLLAGIVKNSTIIMSPKTLSPFDADLTLRLIQKHKITNILLSPDYLAELADLNDFDTVDLSHVRNVQTTGDALMKTLRILVEDHLSDGAKVIQSYGLTEICGICTLNHPFSKEYSVGRPVNQCEFKIVDTSGNPLGPSEHGEILIKPPHPFIGYYNQEKTFQIISNTDEWVRTGDIGYFDVDSFLFLTGRKDDKTKFPGFQMSGQIETQSIMMKQSVLTHHNVEENLYNEPEVGFGFAPKIIEVGCHHEILAEINGHEPLKEIHYDAHA